MNKFKGAETKILYLSIQIDPYGITWKLGKIFPFLLFVNFLTENFFLVIYSYLFFQLIYFLNASLSQRPLLAPILV